MRRKKRLKGREVRRREEKRKLGQERRGRSGLRGDKPDTSTAKNSPRRASDTKLLLVGSDGLLRKPRRNSKIDRG